MSFLGYIGKSLGAGSAPIARGVETATYEQSADEYRRDRANREEVRRMEMAGLRRAEQVAIDAEDERQRGQDYLRGLKAAGLPIPDMGVIPTISENAPTTLRPVPAGLPAATTAAPAAPAAVPTVSPAGGFTADDIRTGEVLEVTPSGYTPLAERTLRFLFDRVPEREEALKLIEEAIAASDRKLGSQRPELVRGRKVGGSRNDSRITAERERLIALRDELKPEPKTYFLGVEIGATTPIPSVTPPSAGLPAPAVAAPAAAVAAPAAPAVAPAAGGPADIRPTGASAAPAAPAPSAVDVPGAEIFMPIVNTYAYLFPDLPYDIIVPTISMLAGGESPNFNLKAQNGQHIGAFQFNEANQKEYAKRLKAYGLDFTTAEGQTLAAMMLMNDNAKRLKFFGVNDITPINLVSAHNQGARGFAALVNNPDMNAAEALDIHAPVKGQPGRLRVGNQAWMDPDDVDTTTAGQFVESMQAYYGKYSPTYSNVKSSPINPDIYRDDPKGLTKDMLLAEFTFNVNRQRQKDFLNLIDASDPFSATTQQQLANAYTLSETLVQQSAIYAQLQITKGLTAAYGGDTSYLNGVLSAVMDYPIEVMPYAGEQGIMYQITTGGQPVTDFLSNDQMKQYVMRIADSQYDAELTALEIAAAAKANEITLQLGADVQKILAQGAVNLGLAEYRAEADSVLAKLNAELEAQGQGVEIKKLTDTPQGDVLATDNLGRVYKVTTRRQRIGGKMQDITSLERVDVEGQSE